MACLKSRSTILALLAAMTDADHQRNVAAGQVMGLQRLGRDARLLAQARLHRHDLAADDDPGIDLAERHSQQVEDADPRPGRDRLDPEPEVPREDGEDHQHGDHRGEDRHDQQDLSEIVRRLLGKKRHGRDWGLGIGDWGSATVLKRPHIARGGSEIGARQTAAFRPAASSPSRQPTTSD